MDTKPNSNFAREIIFGVIILLIILVGGTLMTGSSVSEDTEKAVRTVSLLYLDELAERREQVVSSTLNEYVGDMSVALGLMERDDLSSVERLQAYQTRMKQLYDLDRFAFVDADGIIYTSRGTRNDIALYNFDYKNLVGPVIAIKNAAGNDRKVIVAVPVDNLPFNGKNFVACFMEIDISHLLMSASLNANNSGTTFCNIYSTEGVSLANVVLGGLSNESNLFNALNFANFDDGYSLNKMRSDFAESKRGIASFTYEGVRETMCYVPVRGADWMLTYLIRESVISDLIGSITDGIVFRSLIQSVLIALVLIAMFVMMIKQTRKAAKITLAKEVAETESRVKQQELEEQLALQEELLDQEKKRAQQDSMITALASDYRSVYYVNLDTDECVCYRRDALAAADSIEEGALMSFKELFTRHAEKYVTEEYRDGFLKFIEPASIRAGLEKSKMITYRYLTTRNGKESYEMIRMAGVRHTEDRVDHIIHAVGVGFTDIDAEMRKSLEKSRALSDALKTAEEASRAKTAFLSSVSHEIRTPMNAIIGLDSLALHEPDLPATARDYLEKIGSSAQHLLSLINDILDMSRIESGRMSIKSEEFSFSKMVEQINTMFSSQCHDKKLHYDCRINGHVDDYYIGDSVKLRQVLINILSNAVKFTPEGGNIDFVIERTANFDGKSTLKFTVKDTGIGISEEFLPKIFDTFTQEDSGTTNKYGSSGLGMAITKNIVEMMNGKIEVASTKGVGTTFTVVVTLLDSDKKDGASKDVEVRPQDMSVLVIDDDPIACEHAKLVLSKAGIVSDYVMSGREAIEMVKTRHARRDPYILIVVDWQMPEMDGLEVTRQIRSIIGDESPIIILTAYNWDEIAEEATAAGVDSFIAKPLFTSNLLEEFRSALQKKNSAKAVEKPKADLAGRKILLAEDMQVNAEIMMMVLSMRELEAEHAVNGKVAVEMFEKSAPGYYSAVLMDVRMPEMDGLQATQAIRALDRPDAKTIPIIALTANAFDEDVQRSLQAGMNAHLTKPVEPEVLFDTLESMIEP